MSPMCLTVRPSDGISLFAGWGLQHGRQALSHSLAFQTVSETLSPHPLGTQLLPVENRVPHIKGSGQKLVSTSFKSKVNSHIINSEFPEEWLNVKLK